MLGAAFCLSAALSFCAPSTHGRQGVVESPAPRQARTLLGVVLGREASSWLGEVEGRLGREVYAEFAELDPEGAGGDYTLGASYLTRAGVGVVRVDESVRARGARATEAVIAHELLHLRLRARGYPLFLFSPEVMTRRGPAQEVEQEHVNDLVSLIEHRVFAAEMRRSGFDKLIDLTNGLDAARRRRGERDGQAEALNYARASLEWGDPRLLEELAGVHRANGWTRSLGEGRRLSEIIRGANITSPRDVAPVFLRCMSVLYAADFRLDTDARFPLSKIYPQVLIRSPRPAGKRRGG
ncbi:MAG TPA: hypothetical protein VF736_18405 [Pyrinomonadaceae bacterium]